jgi:hypothetical protein
MNGEQLEEKEELVALKKDMESYFSLQKRMKLQDRFVVAKEHPEITNRSKELAILALLWPLALLGLIHGLIPYLIVKKLTEKMFRRKVFWGSVKMMLGKLFGTLYNVPLIILLTHFLFPFVWMGWVYYFVIPVICRVALTYVVAFREFRIKGVMRKTDVSKFTERRADLMKRIEALVPVA